MTRLAAPYVDVAQSSAQRSDAAAERARIYVPAKQGDDALTTIDARAHIVDVHGERR